MPDQAGTVTAGGNSTTVVFHPDGSQTGLFPGQSAPFNYGDVISTSLGGSARGVMTDGSILNVGSNAQLEVQQINSEARRTLLQQIYGEIRAWTVRIFGGGGDGTNPGGPVGLITNVQGYSNYFSNPDCFMG